VKYLLLAGIIALQGCSTFNVDPIIPPNATITLAKEVFEPCKMLPEDIVLLTFEDVLNAYGGLSMLYGECATKQNNSIKLLKQFSNK